MDYNANSHTSSSKESSSTHLHNLEGTKEESMLTTKDLLDKAQSHYHAGAHLRTPNLAIDTFNPKDPTLKEDIIRMIAQYLNDEGYQCSKMTLQDEANVKVLEQEEQQQEIKRLKKAILEGDWTEIDKITVKPLMKSQKSFLYTLYKQQYLEYIEHGEVQKAFSCLNKRLKPLEHYQTLPNEFKDLCYLITSKSVHEAPSFKNWEGVMASRERLVEHLQNLYNIETTDRNMNLVASPYVPPNRLLTLLNQAVAYQIEFSRYHSRLTPRIETLLQDYSSFIIPNTVCHTFIGHKGNVKCAKFVGEDGRYIISGSSDNTLRLWDTESSECLSILHGHSSRIWDVSSTRKGDIVASGSGDGTVKLWDIKGLKVNCTLTIEEVSGDIYTVQFHPSETHLVSGGYDKVLRLIDLNTGSVVKTFSGHQLSISKAVFNPLGNLIISGSKDNTIKFWDIVSGLCIKTISSHLGEVTSVEVNPNGTLLLSSSKDNSNRLWDIRMVRPIGRFKGHQNTSKNFVRAGFANRSLIVGGSEDGIVYLWDESTGDIVQKLKGHTGIVYSSEWNAKQSLFCSCSDDRTIKTWWFDESRPIQEYGEE